VLALLAALGLVLAATAVGLILGATQGRVRSGSRERIEPADVGLTADAFGERITLLQFSTEFCSRCPGVRRMLTAVADELPGTVHADVDLTHRPDIATRYDVLQTPTTLVLDRRGVVTARIGGVPDRARIRTLLAELAATAAVPAGARPPQETKDRT
jgi:thiol-disulfide isomerase/thioredoxin